MCSLHEMEQRKEACRDLFQRCIVVDHDGTSSALPADEEQALVTAALDRICTRASCDYVDYVLKQRAPMPALRALYLMLLLITFLAVALFYCHSCLIAEESFDSSTATPPPANEYTEHVARLLVDMGLVRPREPPHPSTARA